MKFTVDVLGLVFLLLKVQGSSLLDATGAISKPKEAVHSATLAKSPAVPHAVHMSAQSTIPTKIAHAHAVSPKLKVPLAALTGINKSEGSNRPFKQAKKSKELRKALNVKIPPKQDKNLNKSNGWGLFDAKVNASAGNHTEVVHTHASESKNHTNSSTKPAIITPDNHTKELQVWHEVPLKVNGNANHAAAVKAAPKETKSEKPKMKVHIDATAPKVVAKEANATKATAAKKTVSHAKAVVKAAPNTPHVLVKATTKTKSSSRSAAAVAAQNHAEYQLLNFLASEDEKKELPPFEVYLPACLDHLHDLVDNLDMSYTDVQLHAVLVDECWLKKSFPKSHDSSFSSDEACKKFATSLVNARYLELQMGSQEGYEGFCADYYVHIGGSLGKKKAAPPPPAPKKKRASFPWHFFIVAAVILILFAILVGMLMYKKSQTPRQSGNQAIDYS